MLLVNKRLETRQCLLQREPVLGNQYKMHDQANSHFHSSHTIIYEFPSNDFLANFSSVNASRVFNTLHRKNGREIKKSAKCLLRIMQNDVQN